MTNEEWERVRKNVEESASGIAYLLIDGYEIALCMQPVSRYKNGIAVYVNGHIKSEWLLRKDKTGLEICQRFFQPHTKTPIVMKGVKLSEKQKAELKEKFGYTYYDTWWTSFRRLKAHLVRNNKNITVMEKGLTR